jgi:GNAT superfamily N-acetyltransferase
LKAAPYRIVPLDPELDRSRFASGVDALDRYFRERVMQDVRRHVANCFVALDGDGGPCGYSTLAAASVLLSGLPESVARKLPRYPTVPAVRLGRLAVARANRGQGLGAALLADALARSLASDIAAFAMIVDAKDAAAAAFYAHHGFLPFADSPGTLFLPLATARAALR